MKPLKWMAYAAVLGLAMATSGVALAQHGHDAAKRHHDTKNPTQQQAH